MLDLSKYLPEGILDYNNLLYSISLAFWMGNS